MRKGHISSRKSNPTRTTKGSVVETTSTPGRASDLTITNVFMALLQSRKWLPAGIRSTRFRHRFANRDTAAILDAYPHTVDATKAPQFQTLTHVIATFDSIHRPTVLAALPRIFTAVLLVNLLLAWCCSD